MFTQQLVGLIIIAYFAIRLFQQKKSKQINSSEFSFWLVFWILAGLAIIFLRQIDELARRLGFSASGIDVLLYLGAAMLFYFVFRLRLRLAQMEKDITKVVREIALKDKDK